MQPPTADLTESTSIYHVSLLGTYANGTNFSIGLDGTDATIHVDDSDKSMLVKYFGGDEISWEGTSLLEPNPIYTVKVNSSRQNVYGTMTLRGRVRALSQIDFRPLTIHRPPLLTSPAASTPPILPNFSSQVWHGLTPCRTQM